MSRMRTRCITWGEFMHSGSPIIDGNGRRVGMIDFAEWVTLCGRQEENPKDACALDHRKPRPKGVCLACWKLFRKSMESAGMLESFGGEPVHVILTVGGGTMSLGTDKVVVSHLRIPNQPGESK